MWWYLKSHRPMPLRYRVDASGYIAGYWRLPKHPHSWQQLLVTK